MLKSKGVKMVPFMLNYTTESAQGILKFTMDRHACSFWHLATIRERRQVWGPRSMAYRASSSTCNTSRILRTGMLSTIRFIHVNTEVCKCSLTLQVCEINRPPCGNCIEIVKRSQLWMYINCNKPRFENKKLTSFK